jgi:hypothetical protein
MSVNSAINNLIGTFTEINTSTTTIPDTGSCICFDTSTNRIGINTTSPAYAIEVKDTPSESGTIKTVKLITDELILKDGDNSYRIRINGTNVFAEII